MSRNRHAPPGGRPLWRSEATWPLFPLWMLIDWITELRTHR